MTSKIFALASVMALTGLVSTVAIAGCSTKDEAGAKVVAGDAQPPVTLGPDGGGIAEGDGGGGGGSSGCMQTNAIDATKFPYQPAKKQPNACSQKELDSLTGYFTDQARKQQDISVLDWRKTVSDGCAQCAFSDEGETNWAPILTKGDKLDDVNRGGCIEIASGKQSCGQAYQQVAECRLAACTDTCETPDGFSACLNDVQGIFTGPCKTAYTTMERECGEDLAKYEAQCKGSSYTFEGPVKVQCVNGGV
jgi:hypothetical protein